MIHRVIEQGPISDTKKEKKRIAEGSKHANVKNMLGKCDAMKTYESGRYFGSQDKIPQLRHIEMQ